MHNKLFLRVYVSVVFMLIIFSSSFSNTMVIDDDKINGNLYVSYSINDNITISPEIVLHISQKYLDKLSIN